MNEILPDEQGRRIMTAEQILERERLNMENTAPRLAARAAAARAKLNGHTNGHSLVDLRGHV